MRLAIAACLALLIWPSAGLAKPRDQGNSQIPAIRLERGVLFTPCRGPLLDTIEPRFGTDAECVEAWVQLTHVSREHRLRFVYFSPWGTEYVASPEGWSFGPGQSSSYHKYGWIRHQLAVAGQQAALLPGEWRVAVWLDDSFLSDGRFRLERPALPETTGIDEVRSLYVGLQYESALERLEALLPSLTEPRVAAEAQWWLALCHYSVGATSSMDSALSRLLQMEPTFSQRPDQIKETGAEPVWSALQTMRTRSAPQLYSKTSGPPGLELSHAVVAPQVRKPWPLWKKLLVYVGLPAVAIGTTGILVARNQRNEEILDLVDDWNLQGSIGQNDCGLPLGPRESRLVRIVLVNSDSSSAEYLVYEEATNTALFNFGVSSGSNDLVVVRGVSCCGRELGVEDSCPQSGIVRGEATESRISGSIDFSLGTISGCTRVPEICTATYEFVLTR